MEQELRQVSLGQIRMKAGSSIDMAGRQAAPLSILQPASSKSERRDLSSVFSTVVEWTRAARAAGRSAN